MIKKIKGSLAYRLPVLYRNLLRFKKVAIFSNKPQSDIMVIMMTGKHHIKMTQLSLKSIADSWSVLPKIIITTDGTISAAAVAQNFKFWPGELLVEDWADITHYHVQKGRDVLVRYGMWHPFGKKLAVILRYAEKHPIVWIDSDILFFKDFIPYIPQSSGQFACGGTEDVAAAYHNTVLEIFDNNLYNLYKFNAGLLYVYGNDIYEQFDLEGVIQAIHPNYDFCTEQSIFAHIASKSLGILWSLDIVRNFNEDNQQIRPMVTDKTIARHYTTNVRHLFWREAFFRI